MHQIMGSRTFEWPKKAQNNLSSKSTIFQYNMRHSSIYVLAPILALGYVKLYIMCVGTITGRKLTEGYVTLC